LRWRRANPMIIAHALINAVAFVGYALLAPTCRGCREVTRPREVRRLASIFIWPSLAEQRRRPVQGERPGVDCRRYASPGTAREMSSYWSMPTRR
jgi:hypothetical protein